MYAYAGQDSRDGVCWHIREDMLLQDYEMRRDVNIDVETTDPYRK